jgi:hypothetical protein
VDQFDSAPSSNKSFNEIKGKGILVYDNPRLPASAADATAFTFMVERIDIERALDKIASDEAGPRFQSLAAVLAKLRWPELIACERHNDRGLDAHAPISVSPDGRGKGLACSTTGTLDKIKSDAEKVQKYFPDVSLLIFYTTQKVTQSTKADWADKIQEKYGYELIVASRAEIIASLQLPDNFHLCNSTGIEFAVWKVSRNRSKLMVGDAHSLRGRGPLHNLPAGPWADCQLPK